MSGRYVQISRAARAYERKIRAHCTGCKHFRVIAGFERYCNYIGDTGVSRGCSPLDCELYEGRRKKK